MRVLECDYLHERLAINAETGKCYWLSPSPYHGQLLGREAGYPNTSRCGKKYWVIKLDGVRYKRSQLVFLSAHRRWPAMVDHIDGDSLNDRPINLREATVSQNSWNHKGRKKKSQLPMGVRFASGSYQARISFNKQPLFLGCFPTVEQAVAVYTEKRRELFGEYCGL